jgi:hypothetical protein
LPLTLNIDSSSHRKYKIVSFGYLWALIVPICQADLLNKVNPKKIVELCKLGTKRSIEYEVTVCSLVPDSSYLG